MNTLEELKSECPHFLVETPSDDDASGYDSDEADGITLERKRKSHPHMKARVEVPKKPTRDPSIPRSLNPGPPDNCLLLFSRTPASGKLA